VLLEKRSPDLETGRFGAVTTSFPVPQPSRPRSGRLLLIAVTVTLLMAFLVLTVMKDPVRIFREDPRAAAAGSGAGQAVPQGRIGGQDPDDIPLSLGPEQYRVPPEDLLLTLIPAGAAEVPLVDLGGLTDGSPPVCWVPRHQGETIEIDAGGIRSWSHLLLYRCSLPDASDQQGEVQAEVTLGGGYQTRVMRLSPGASPTRLDLAGHVSDRLFVSLTPSGGSSGLSGVVAYCFKE